MITYTDHKKNGNTMQLCNFYAIAKNIFNLHLNVWLNTPWNSQMYNAQDFSNTREKLKCCKKETVSWAPLCP